jgi:hypothetical protein
MRACKKASTQLKSSSLSSTFIDTTEEQNHISSSFSSAEASSALRSEVLVLFFALHLFL